MEKNNILGGDYKGKDILIGDTVEVVELPDEVFSLPEWCSVGRSGKAIAPTFWDGVAVKFSEHPKGSDGIMGYPSCCLKKIE